MRKILKIIIAALSVCLTVLLVLAFTRRPDPQQPPEVQTPTVHSPQTTPSTSSEPTLPPDYEAMIAELRLWVPESEAPEQEFLPWVKDTLGGEAIQALVELSQQQEYDRTVWFTATGNSWQALRRLYQGDSIHVVSLGIPGQQETTTLVFGGDICLADNYLPMEHLAATGGTVADAIDPVLTQILQQADVAYLNNEFTISDRGTPMLDKYYTFRAAVQNTAIYQQLGIDIVSLANNHAYDFGTEAFLDTLDALERYGVAYIGGGRNLEEAMAPQYYLVNGWVIAYVAATRAEKFKMTPEAGENSPGVLRCYDTELFCRAIAEAKANSDYVVACVHWGWEYEYTLQEEQTTSAREYIDAGADVIIGAHAHQLQGIEYYNGKPIFYNLGNFWFNEKEIDTCLVEMAIAQDGTVAYTFLPALQKDFTTTAQIGTQRGAQIIANLNQYCIGAEITADGTVQEVK